MTATQRERVAAWKDQEIPRKSVSAEALPLHIDFPFEIENPVRVRPSHHHEEVSPQTFFKSDAQENNVEKVAEKKKGSPLKRLARWVGAIAAGLGVAAAFLAPHAGHIAMTVGSFAIFGMTYWNIVLGITLILSIAIPYVIWLVWHRTKKRGERKESP